MAGLMVQLTEAIEDGNRALSLDLVEILRSRTAGGSHTRKKRVVCSTCGEDFPFPGDLHRHKVIRGHGDLE